MTGFAEEGCSVADDMLRTLVIHNYYRQRGGEDAVAETEVELLRSRGHEVEFLTAANEALDERRKVRAATNATWSRSGYALVSRTIDEFAPDVMHVHNTFSMLSPSIYYAAARAGIPVVQTLHNFRLSCLQAMFYRDGHVCEDCVGRLPWRGVVRRCYRGSRSQSAVLAAGLLAHRALGTYSRYVTTFIALNDFCRRKFIESGLPADRIVVKPNFVDANRPPEGYRHGGLFVGRLSPEKGIRTLVQALRRVPELRITVLGDGPENALVRDNPQIDWRGATSAPEVRRYMEQAAFLIMPSLWYENFPRALVEAFAAGLPVVASRIGALADLVSDRKTGLSFEVGNPVALAQCMSWAAEHESDMRSMGRAARREYEDRYTADANYTLLRDIYRAAKNRQSSVGQSEQDRFA